MSALYDRIYSLARTRGMSIPEVAKKAGLSSAIIYRWRTNDANPTKPSLIAVATALGVSEDELVGKKEVDPQEELASQVGALFRSVVKQQDLDEDHSKDLKEEMEDLLKVRARRLKAKQDAKN
ncbi:transcriptional regulator [Lacticaseibacillus casei]|nr:transcriptional regulator [Lacticaseibacillus casei]